MKPQMKNNCPTIFFLSMIEVKHAIHDASKLLFTFSIDNFTTGLHSLFLPALRMDQLYYHILCFARVAKPRLNPTISKNREKFFFSVYAGKFQTDKFFLQNRIKLGTDFLVLLAGKNSVIFL
jgi:hypothetical protein